MFCQFDKKKEKKRKKRPNICQQEKQKISSPEPAPSVGGLLW